MKKWSLRILVTSAFVVAVLFLSSSAAWACSNYQWAGKYSSLTWNGVAGNITVDGESVPNTSGYHILNYVDMSNPSMDCQGLGSCWIQAGNSLGFTGISGWSKYCQSSYVEAYVEVDDVNAYGCYGYTSGQLSLAQTDYYTVYYDQTCNGTLGRESAYVYNGSGWYLIGQSWIGGCGPNATVYGQSEMDEFGGTGCPTLNQYQYFGNNGLEMQQSPDGKSWQAWTTSLQHGPYSPLSISPNPVTGSDSFHTWG